MESRLIHRPPVKWFSQKTGEIIDGGKASTEKISLVEMSLRINGYLNGTFARGKKFHVWDKYQFERATASHKPRKMSHIEQAMTQFRKQSTQWRFEDIWYKGHRRIKITPLSVVQQLPSQFETTRRFLAYVTNSAKMNGAVNVDIIFLHRFWQTTGLPEEWIRIAWQRLHKIRGYRLRWKGQGRGRKCVVSLPYFFTRPSFPTERRLRKTVGRGAPDFPDGIRSSDALRAGVNRDAADNEQPESQSASPAAASSGDPPIASPQIPPRLKIRLGKVGSTLPDRAFPASCAPPPFKVGEHWISAERTLRKAQWLAVSPMKNLHGPSCRVRWRFAHARGVAYRALLAGHTERAILEAWRDAIGKSHEDACDHDLRQRPARDSAPIMREPSAAVMYAWQILARDRRTKEQRWAEIFSHPKPAATAKCDVAGGPSNGRVTEKRDGAARRNTRAVTMPDKKIAAQKTIEEHLAAKGLALPDLLKMTRPEQAAFIASAFHAQGGGEK